MTMFASLKHYIQGKYWNINSMSCHVCDKAHYSYRYVSTWQEKNKDNIVI